MSALGVTRAGVRTASRSRSIVPMQQGDRSATVAPGQPQEGETVRTQPSTTSASAVSGRGAS